jgi:hypothetical protein
MHLDFLRTWMKHALRPVPKKQLLRFLQMGLLAQMIATSFGIASAQVRVYPIPREVRSTHYIVTLDGQTTPVVHAASDYYLLNFDTAGPVTVKVTAADPHFWDHGVEVQPMRLGIRPVRHGATITFQLAGPEKLTISRPGDHFAEADMLFLFANEQETSKTTAATPGVRYYGPGVYHEAIDAHSGDVIYLAGGAIVFGSLNMWQVHDVRVLGRGMVIYDGPQNPETDNGWMHKRDWHAIVMDNAKNIEIDGITTVVRSRTWQIQMKDSHNIGFYNIKVVAGTKGDANQDGMDWLGGGDTTIRNSFFRASDDVFALQGNWDGYDLALMRKPGHDVRNISISDSVVSTSISNTIRVAWPEKTFNSAHFHMNNMDVLATGYGDCKVPFAFFELWADPNGHGSHTDYSFENIRLEDWYSLFQIRQPAPMVRDVRFADIWAMDGPAMVPSAVKGNVKGVSLQGAPVEIEPNAAGASTTGPDTEGPDTVQVLEGADEPTILPAAVDATFAYTAGALKPGMPILFAAHAPMQPGRQYRWLFGDGTRAEGFQVKHRFTDAQGTLLDGSGRYRVLLHVTDADGGQSWHREGVVLGGAPLLPVATGTSTKSEPGDYATDWSINIPADGGYTFTVLTRSVATVALDMQAALKSPVGRSRACGSIESAVQPVVVSGVLKAGMHRLHVAYNGGSRPQVLWEGPGVERQLLP